MGICPGATTGGGGGGWYARGGGGSFEPPEGGVGGFGKVALVTGQSKEASPNTSDDSPPPPPPDYFPQKDQRIGGMTSSHMCWGTPGPPPPPFPRRPVTRALKGGGSGTGAPLQRTPPPPSPLPRVQTLSLPPRLRFPPLCTGRGGSDVSSWHAVQALLELRRVALADGVFSLLNRAVLRYEQGYGLRCACPALHASRLLRRLRKGAAWGPGMRLEDVEVFAEAAVTYWTQVDHEAREEDRRRRLSAMHKTQEAIVATQKAAKRQQEMEQLRVDIRCAREAPAQARSTCHRRMCFRAPHHQPPSPHMWEGHPQPLPHHQCIISTSALHHRPSSVHTRPILSHRHWGWRVFK